MANEYLILVCQISLPLLSQVTQYLTDQSLSRIGSTIGILTYPIGAFRGLWSFKSPQKPSGNVDTWLTSYRAFDCQVRAIQYVNCERVLKALWT